MNDVVDQAEAETVAVSSGLLGAPGRCEPLRCSALAIELLTQAAGPEMALASFSLELGPRPLEDDVEIEVRVRTDKRTRTIAFLSLEAMSGDAVVFGARGVFSAARG